MPISENLDKIQGLVEEKFKDIKNTDRTCARFPGRPCSEEHLQVQSEVGVATVAEVFVS